jgi:predicted GNAT family N-acyltransferase
MTSGSQGDGESALTLRVVTEDRDLWKVLVVRGIVFVEEQGVPYDGEVDEHEDGAVHVLGEVDGEPVASGRLRFVEGWAKLERIAVRRAWRGRGHGSAVVRFLIDEARRRGHAQLRMHAQAHLAQYYATFGFAVQGEIFQECGIDHYLMVRVD